MLLLHKTKTKELSKYSRCSNQVNLDQLHLLNVGDHFSSIDIQGSSNILDIDQKESGDKIMFLDIDSSNNVTVLQEGTGNHFLDIDLTR